MDDRLGAFKDAVSETSPIIFGSLEPRRKQV